MRHFWLFSNTLQRRKNFSFLNSWKVVLHFLTERVKNVWILYINATLALLKYVKKNSCIIFFNLIFPSKHQFYRTLFAIQFRLLRTFFANKPMASTNSWAFIYARARNIDAYVRRIFFFLWVFFLGAMRSKYRECTTAKALWMKITKNVSFDIWKKNRAQNIGPSLKFWRQNSNFFFCFENFVRYFSAIFKQCAKRLQLLIYQLLSKSFITLEDGWVQ